MNAVQTRTWLVQGKGFLKWHWEFTLHYVDGTQTSYAGRAITKWGATRKSKRVALANGWE